MYICALHRVSTENSDGPMVSVNSSVKTPNELLTNYYYGTIIYTTGKVNVGTSSNNCDTLTLHILLSLLCAMCHGAPAISIDINHAREGQFCNNTHYHQPLAARAPNAPATPRRKKSVPSANKK